MIADLRINEIYCMNTAVNLELTCKHNTDRPRRLRSVCRTTQELVTRQRVIDFCVFLHIWQICTLVPWLEDWTRIPASTENLLHEVFVDGIRLQNLWKWETCTRSGLNIWKKFAKQSEGLKHTWAYFQRTLIHNERICTSQFKLCTLEHKCEIGSNKVWIQRTFSNLLVGSL